MELYLHSQVTPGHHDGISHLNDPVDLIQRFRLLYFRHYPGNAVMPLHHLPQIEDILFLPDKR